MIIPYFETEKITLFQGDCREVLASLSENSIDMIFADPPYFLSNGGISCKAGKIVSVNKADWDKSGGFDKDFEFTYNWIKSCKRILKENGTIWISGTMHNIYQIGYSLQKLNFKILNEIIWYKPNSPPNLTHKYFTHSHETIIWARKNKSKPHFFNYFEMKNIEDKNSFIGKQMKSVWNIHSTPKEEKILGKHPTQKPLELLRRIILSSTKENEIVLDPFNGSGTTGFMAKMLNRRYIGIDKEEEYLKITVKRINSIKNKNLVCERV
jgi:site-specific DNA-methyltransferase (adenine-specific)